MTKQDSECRTQEPGAERGVSQPDSLILNPEAERRLHWRCRRGLLELDIVLERFVERGYANLDDAGKIEFDVLLDLPDTSLWDRISGKEPVTCAAQKKILESINAA